ncbi:MAG: hypothetical protein IJT23_03180 [Clostridia bacterium]|nr:hypothetical protein [Clostridia bacterium]
MSKNFKKLFSAVITVSMAASVFVAPAQAKEWKAYKATYNADKSLQSVTVTTVTDPSNLISNDTEKYFIWDNSMEPAPTAEPIEEPTVVKSWKFDFGDESDVEAGYTYVSPDTNYTTNTSGTDQYGFIGTNSQDYKLGNRLDGFTTQKGQTITLTEGGTSGLYDGIGSTGQDSYGNAGDKYYPVRFALKVPDETYYRVRATVTTLDPTKDAVASLYTERKHPIFTEETIKAGETITEEFTIRVTPIYYEKSEPKGTIKDEMVNVCVLGTNSALAAIEIDQIETAPVLWVLGDSTVTDGNCNLPFSPLQNYTGVGTGLTKYLPSHIAMVNEGEGGLAANDNYHFNMVKSRIKSGDYMYVEYGHNHKNDGVAGYLGNLDKYYQACKAVGATLIIVGPIDRHNTYNSETNTWSTSLAQFSRGGKGYVDSMMYGGESAANTFVSTYQSSGEADALAYRDSVVANANGEKAVENVAFVDLNQPSLDWFATVTAKGSIGGTEVTNSSKLIDYYFQTGRGGSTDGTHPNDTGAQNLAYFFYTTADTEAYPALEPLMRNFKSGETHYYPTPVEQAAMDAGQKAGQGNVGWPQYVVPTDNEYPVAIKNITFNESGVIESAKVVVQDAKFSMSAYGIIVVTVKDEDGNEVGKLYAVDQVDNSTGTGEQTIVNFTGDAVLPAEGSYTAQVWQALDTDEGLKLDPQNIAYSDVYVPTEIVDYILPGDTTDVETFEYYGAEKLTDTGKYIYGGSAGADFTIGTDDDRTYANVKVTNQGNSFWLYRAFENLTGGTGTTGKYLINTDIKYISGSGLSIDLGSSVKSSSPFVYDPYKLLTIFTNGSVSVNGKTVGNLKSEVWTNLNYVLDMNAGTATVSIDNAEPVVVELPEYATFGNATNPSFNYFVFDGTKSTFDMQFANLTVAKLRSTDKTTLTVASEDETKGSAYIGTAGTVSKKVAIATEIGATAVAADGYRFTGWYNGDTLFSEDADITITRLYKDLDLVAKFALSTSPATVTVNFKDGDGNTIKTSDTITEADGNTLYSGDAFTLDSAYLAAVKTAKATDGTFTVYEYDSAKSDAVTIDSLAVSNTINLVFTDAGTFYEYEDFTNSSVGDWGFTEGKGNNVNLVNGTLQLFANAGTSAQKSDVKTFDSNIQSAKNVEVTFDWRTGVESGKGRNSLFNLKDSSGTVIFTLDGNGKNGVNASVAGGAVGRVGSGVNNWIRVTLSIDFTAGTVSGTAKDLSTNATLTIPSTSITATNLATMSADYGYSAAPQYIDNVSIKKLD